MEVILKDMNINCVIVDDDPVSRKLIGELVNKTEWLNLVGTFDSAVSAGNELPKLDIDIILLDVEMPEMTGLEFLNNIQGEFNVILITSKQEYAVEAFDLNALDYITKPVNYARFVKACEKARKSISEGKTSKLSNHLFVKSGTVYERIELKDINYIESMGDYISIHTSTKRHVINITMKETMEKLSKLNFARIHRSFIINMDKVETIEDNSVAINGKSLPISRSHKKDLMEKLKFF